MSDNRSTSSKFETYLIQSIRWIKDHKEQAATILGISAVVVILALFLINNKLKANNAAWMQLADVQGKAFQGKHQEALDALKTWEASYANTKAAPYALFLKGDLLLNTKQYDEAEKIYSQIAQSKLSEKLKPLAWAGKCTALELSQKYAETRNCAHEMVAAYPDHFVTGTMLFTEARMTDILKQPQEAQALFNRFALLYPDSPWTAYAKRKASLISGQPIKN